MLAVEDDDGPWLDRLGAGRTYVIREVTPQPLDQTANDRRLPVPAAARDPQDYGPPFLRCSVHTRYMPPRKRREHKRVFPARAAGPSFPP